MSEEFLPEKKEEEISAMQQALSTPAEAPAEVKEEKAEEKPVEKPVEAPAEVAAEKPAEAPEEQPAIPPAPVEERRWYVIQTLTGNEELVKTSIERSVKQFNIEDKVFNVLVPEEDIVEIKSGKRVERKKKMFPGYVFVEMMLNENSWHVIKQTPGVAKFIGNKTRPIPVTDREMQRVLKQLGVREEKIDVYFEKGEAMRIISGPFRGYTGSVEEINPQKGKIKALVNIFGRDTPVEIDFEQAEKIT
jgi:transcriptional antiterminator NusG